MQSNFPKAASNSPVNAKTLIVVVLCGAVSAGIVLNQWRLQRELQRVARDGEAQGVSTNGLAENALAQLRQAEARYDEARRQLELAEQKLARADVQIAALENRLHQIESNLRAPTRIESGKRTLTFVPELEPAGAQKRSWGPEQAVGEPDTSRSGDIPTAWAPLEQDGGEEWLKLDYENAVDIAEVRVRETHNPGAISKVTALAADGNEVTLWEGVEPKSEAPVEMTFSVPNSVNARSVKVYLDTRRVPGWNEIDAVQLIGRDGSQQWAKQATASSTYAEPNVANRTRGLDRF